MAPGAAATAGARDGAGTHAHWWQQCRQETPGCQHVIHFNNAGASLQPAPVVEAVQRYVAEEAVMGGYETASKHAEALRRPYTALAQLLNCSPDEIAIVSSATSAWGQVFFGIPLRPGDVILTSQAEYGSNFLAFLQAGPGRCGGLQVRVVPETPDGDIDIPQLQCLLVSQPRPALVAISHVPTSSGRMYDAAAVGAAAREAGVPFLLDACQSAGQVPLDVQQLQCDFLTGTSRKYLRGPRGIGFLYARQQRAAPPHAQGAAGPPGDTGAGSSESSSRAAKAGGGHAAGSKAGSMRGWEPAMVDIHGAAWLADGTYCLADGAARYEQYELSFAAKVGFGVAVEYGLAQGPARCWARTRELAARLRAALAARVPGLTVRDRGAALCGIVSFTLDSPSVAAGEVKAWLAGRTPPINVSVSSMGSTRLDFEARGIAEVVRASVAYYNSEEEVEALVEALQQLVAGTGGRSPTGGERDRRAVTLTTD